MSFSPVAGAGTFAGTMHDVRIDGRPRPVEATWNELTRRRLLALVPLLYRRYDNETEQRLHLLAFLLRVPLSFVVATMTPVQFLELRWLTDFLLDAVQLTAQRLPTVRRGLRRYHGPRAGLRNLRFLEFVFADSYFVAYARSGDAQWLDRLLAVLYRPGRLTGARAAGDRRQPFNENLIEARAARLRRLPLPQKLAVATWYRGCRHGLEQQFKRVFIPARQDAAEQAPDGWAFVLRELSGGAFGPLEQTGQQHLHTVLAKMEDDARRAEQLREQAQQAQKTAAAF